MVKYTQNLNKENIIEAIRTEEWWESGRVWGH